MLVSYANAVYGVSSLIIYVVVPSAPFRFTRTCFHPCFGKKKNGTCLTLFSPANDSCTQAHLFSARHLTK